jgi:hypothetical protein
MRPSSADTSELACVKRKMLSTNRSTSWPSKSRKYSATVSPVSPTRARAPGGSFICPYTSVHLESLACAPSLITPPSIISWYKVVALARALADAREHGETAVALRDVVDELHDEHRLADARRRRRGRSCRPSGRARAGPQPAFVSPQKTRRRKGQRLEGRGNAFTTSDKRRERRSGGPSRATRVVAQPRARERAKKYLPLASRVSPFGTWFASRPAVGRRGLRRRAGRTLMPVTSISMSVLWSTKGGASR